MLIIAIFFCLESAVDLLHEAFEKKSQLTLDLQNTSLLGIVYKL